MDKSYLEQLIREEAESAFASKFEADVGTYFGVAEFELNNKWNAVKNTAEFKSFKESYIKKAEAQITKKLIIRLEDLGSLVIKAGNDE